MFRRLCVHAGRRYLMWEDETPFFYLGDTAWEMFHKLNREEMEFYLKTRAKQEYNVIQAVLLAEQDGLFMPNAYGRVPLMLDRQWDICPDEGDGYDYWKHVDYGIDIAAEYSMFIGLLPSWGDKFNLKWGKGPVIFNESNAFEYGRWLGARYRDQWNIIWILGGDRPIENEEQEKIMDAMARGIRSEDQNHLMTFHPCGASSSVDYLKGKEYIDFHSVQSGHALECYSSNAMLRSTMEAEMKPALDMEPRYEDHPACFKEDYGYLWRARDIRQNAWWNLLEGACGITYGNSSVWCFQTEKSGYWPYTWKEAMGHKGARQMKYIKRLFTSRPYYNFRSLDRLLDRNEGLEGQCAGGTEDYAYIYTPFGMPIRANLQYMGGSVIRASWYNPRNGKSKCAKIVPAVKTLFVPPATGENKDWILILEVLEKEVPL